MLTSDSALPTKPLDTSRLHRDTPTQGHPFKFGISNFYLEIQKVKEKER